MIKYGISLILFDNDWQITNNEEQIIRKNKNITLSKQLTVFSGCGEEFSTQKQIIK